MFTVHCLKLFTKMSKNHDQKVWEDFSSILWLLLLAFYYFETNTASHSITVDVMTPPFVVFQIFKALTLKLCRINSHSPNTLIRVIRWQYVIIHWFTIAQRFSWCYTYLWILQHTKTRCDNLNRLKRSLIVVLITGP